MLRVADNGVHWTINGFLHGWFQSLYLVTESTEKDRNLTPSTVSIDVYHSGI